MEKIEDQKIIDALKTVFDPEIPVDIYELGLIGLITFFGMFFLNLRSLLTNIKKTESKIMFVQLLLLILAINSINLIDHILFWFIMAMTYKSFRDKKIPKPN